MSEFAGFSMLAREVTALKLSVSCALPAAAPGLSVKPLAPGSAWQPEPMHVCSMGSMTVVYVWRLNGLGPGGAVCPPPSLANWVAAAVMNVDSLTSSGWLAGYRSGCVCDPPVSTAVRRLLLGVMRSTLETALLNDLPKSQSPGFAFTHTMNPPLPCGDAWQPAVPQLFANTGMT